ncbi:hypothetical protein VTL71DRAFT_9847 [Oculimacula yallundae]|uniref:CMP/dCMP-type deaminase domain-containing protein n=1 Tax=Oculimacula yallundae TaxID=86028 RepID=A0ABR4BQP1_9HELO
MSAFHDFARLPSELRLSIWENALPSADSKTMESFVKALAYLILSQPRDMFYGYGAATKYQDTNIKCFMSSNLSPYADLAACPESRTVALKHLKKLLSSQNDLKRWLLNPKFPFTNPELFVQEREGKLIYRCAYITDGFDMEECVFWKFTEPKPRTSAQMAAFAKLVKRIEEHQVKLTTHEAAEIGMDYCNTDGELEECGTGCTAIIEEEEVFPWDDDSDSEDNDEQAKTPDCVNIAPPKIESVEEDPDWDMLSGATPQAVEPQIGGFSAITKRKKDNVVREDRTCLCIWMRLEEGGAHESNELPRVGCEPPGDGYEYVHDKLLYTETSKSFNRGSIQPRNQHMIPTENSRSEIIYSNILARVLSSNRSRHFSMPQPITSAESALIAAAKATIDAVPRFTSSRQKTDHSVGCAALTSAGRIFTGVNVFHFSGGPCAENIAFGNAAAAGVSSTYAPGIKGPDGQVEKITTCVAVWNDNRGVISPCGRCRQMMLDYYPDIRVIVRDPLGELVTVGIDELLPYAYIVTTRPVLDEEGSEVAKTIE